MPCFLPKCVITLCRNSASEIDLQPRYVLTPALPASKKPRPGRVEGIDFPRRIRVLSLGREVRKEC